MIPPPNPEPLPDESWPGEAEIHDLPGATEPIKPPRPTYTVPPSSMICSEVFCPPIGRFTVNVPDWSGKSNAP